MKKLLILLISIYCLPFFVSGQDSIKENSLSNGDHYALINGVKLWYSVRGKGPLLLFYPSGAGWGGDASIHIKTLQPLEKKRKIIYLEPRGIGHSERLESTDAYSMNNYTIELEAFIEYLNIKSVDLSGHCYGASICLKYAIKHPEKVDKLILMDATPSFQYGDYETWKKNRPGYGIMKSKQDSIRKSDLSRDEKLKGIVRAWTQISIHNYDKNSKVFNGYFDEMNFSPNPYRYYTKYDWNAFNIAESLPFIKANTLIIAGDDDLPFIKTGSKVLAESIPKSKLVIIKDSGHWPFLEQPRQFFKTINSFQD